LPSSKEKNEKDEEGKEEKGKERNKEKEEKEEEKRKVTGVEKEDEWKGPISLAEVCSRTCSIWRRLQQQLHWPMIFSMKSMEIDL